MIDNELNVIRTNPGYANENQSALRSRYGSSLPFPVVLLETPCSFVANSWHICWTFPAYLSEIPTHLLEIPHPFVGHSWLIHWKFTTHLSEIPAHLLEIPGAFVGHSRLIHRNFHSHSLDIPISFFGKFQLTCQNGHSAQFFFFFL